MFSGLIVFLGSGPLPPLGRFWFLSSRRRTVLGLMVWAPPLVLVDVLKMENQNRSQGSPLVHLENSEPGS